MHQLKPVLVDAGRNPFQIWLLAICALTGVLGLLPNTPTRSSVVAVLPSWAALLWYAGLLATGLLGLSALLLALPRCLLVESTAMAVLGGLLSGYSIAVIILADGWPVGAISLISGALAAWWRMWQILRRDLPRLRAAVFELAGGSA